MNNLEKSIPLSAIKEMMSEIGTKEIEYRKKNDRCGIGLDMALRIIDSHLKSIETFKEETT